jgi:hypothetical protein
MGMGVVHSSVAAVHAKLELDTDRVGVNYFTGSRLDYSLIFGPQVIQQVYNTSVYGGVRDVGFGWLPLSDTGRFTLFNAGPAGYDPCSNGRSGITFDFDRIQLTQNMAQN